MQRGLYSKRSVPSKISIKKQSEMRKEWKDVEVVCIDECSMMSLQLLSEVDEALRYAKERNDWFGGVMMVFAGDLCQLPPARWLGPLEYANHTLCEGTPAPSTCVDPRPSQDLTSRGQCGSWPS